MTRTADNTQLKPATLRPLCVDLDGTLVGTDTFHSSLFSLLAKNALYLFKIPVWLLRGKAYVKQQVASRTEVSIDYLRINPEVLTFLENESASGRELYLTTGADQQIAGRIAEAIPIFSGVIASTGALNLTGPRKGEVLQRQFGMRGFDYIGNSAIDLEVWKHANCAYAVTQDPRLIKQIEQVTSLAGTFGTQKPQAALLDYLRIARPDHWFKNIFVIPGILLALFFFPVQPGALLFAHLLTALFACCLVASSNYVLNEVLDAERDRHHPVKRLRPLAAGKVPHALAYLEWIVLGALGIGLGYWTSSYVGGSCLFLWIMGTLYNIPPIRLKELPYFDVLSESINNPIRMAIGWYAAGVTVMPPISALFAYWMFGAFLMATKRLAEYRRIGDRTAAAEYRKSFKYYDEERLIVGTIFYVALFMTGVAVFAMLYRLELILAVPIIAYMLAYYLYLGFQEDSPVQYPERLYRDHTLSAAFLLSALLCLGLFLVDVPQFREMFILLR